MAETRSSAGLAGEEASFHNKLKTAGANLWPDEAVWAYKLAQLRWHPVGWLALLFWDTWTWALIRAALVLSAGVIGATVPLSTFAYFGWPPATAPFMLPVILVELAAAAGVMAGMLMFVHTNPFSVWQWRIDDIDPNNEGRYLNRGFARDVPEHVLALMQRIRQLESGATFRIETLGLDPILRAAPPGKMYVVVLIWDEKGKVVPPPTS